MFIFGCPWEAGLAFVTFQCRSCGAGVESPPDNLLVVCAFCGDRYASKDMGDIPVSLIPSKSKQAVMDAVQKRMAQDDQMAGRHITIESAEGVYVPIFITNLRIDGQWKGYRKVERDDTTEIQWKEGSIDERMDYPILGRKHAHEFGIEVINQVLFEQHPVDFDAVEWTGVGLPVLAVDVDESTVDLSVQDQVINTVGNQVNMSNSLTALTEFDVAVRQENRCIVLFPFWTVQYEYQGGRYRVAVSGGDTQVLAAMEPVFVTSRIFFWAQGVGALVGVGILCNIAGPLLLSGSDDIEDILVMLLVGIGVCAYLAWSTASNMTASIRVERLGDVEELR